MSGFADIAHAHSAFQINGRWSDVNSGLIYTCNAGWVDLGHLNPTSSRPLIGASNLWASVRAEGDAARRDVCTLSAADLNLAYSALGYWWHGCRSDPYFRFEDNRTGYLVSSRQDHGGIPMNPGRQGRFVVKHGLTNAQKKSVALSIFMNVSHQFETFQASWYGRLITNSGYSQEDLVSNLIGFYIAVGEISKEEAIAACHPVDQATAETVWQRSGAVGSNKNRTFEPQMLTTGYDDVEARICRDACVRQPRRFPAVFQTIQPALPGRHYVRLGSGSALIPD